MQIIQSIREKGAAIIIIVIALSLIGFILMDAKTGSSKLFGSGSSSTVGNINGHKVDLAEFNKRVGQEETKMAQQTGNQPGGAEVLRIRDQVWNQLVAENVFYGQSEKLGISLTSKELSAILSSSDPSNPLMQQRGMTDATGKMDPAKAADAINQIKKLKGDERENVYAQIIDPLKLSSTAAKYGGLLSASAYYPKWMKTKDEADAKNFAAISYAAISYNVISDSTVKVSDDEINAYVAKKKALFKQEAGRQISYLSFSELPSAEDSAKIKQQLEELKSSFATDSNAKSFTARNASTIEFKDDFLPLSKIMSSAKDTIVKQSIGTVYGPYVDGKDYALAKVLGTKPLPDSVKARHILVAINDLQTQQPIRSDSAAKQLADSILAAIKGGADFSAMAIKYSADQSNSAKGGDLGTFGYGTMVAEFNEFAFTKPAGEMGVVKTQFGYHVMNIVSQKDFKPAYKIAYVGKPILASDSTINAASLAATKASNNKTSKELAEYSQKIGMKMIDPTPGVIIKENDYSFGQMQDARQLVQWIFKADKGDVSEPIAVGDQFIVATVDKIYEEGTQDAQTARAGAEAMVRNQKKADMITAKLGSNPTVESAAAAYGLQPLMAGADSSITMSARIINGIGSEPKVIGAAFNKEYQSKASPAIPGIAGVYVIKVSGVAQKNAETPEASAAAATTRFAAIRQATNNWFEALRKQADIKDKRSKFF